MILDKSKLVGVKRRRGRIIARCPACAEEGLDPYSNHLIIYKDGKYGCYWHQKPGGHAHRQRIFALVGMTAYEESLRKSARKGKRNKKPVETIQKRSKVINGSTVGHSGRSVPTPALVDGNKPPVRKDVDIQRREGLKTTVPPVPTPETPMETKIPPSTQDGRPVDGIDVTLVADVRRYMDEFKHRVVGVTDLGGGTDGKE